jgi:hypothetical protein
MNWWQQMIHDVVAQLVPVVVGALLHWIGSKSGAKAANGARPRQEANGGGP